MRARITPDPIEVPATQVPRIPADFLAEERRRLGQRVFAQEYECRFMADAGAVFDLEDVMRAVDPSIKPLGVLSADRSGSNWTEGSDIDPLSPSHPARCPCAAH